MSVSIITGSALDVLRTLPSASVQCVVTSPPYFGLRDYGVEGQLGLEPTPVLFIEHLVAIFDEVKRVLRPDGLVFCNLGDSYSGSGKGPTTDASTLGSRGGNGVLPTDKVVLRTAQLRQGFTDGHTYRGIPAKNLLLIPERFSIAMQEAGWIVRSRIAWCKTSAMPESVRDRPTSAWEPIFMFSRSARYFYDGEAVRQPYSRIWDAEASNGTTLAPGSVHTLNTGQPTGHVRYAKPIAPAAGASLRNFWLLGPSPFSDWTQTVRRVPVPLDAIDDDTKRTASPACPLHASRDLSGPSDPGGEHEAASGAWRRSPDTDSDHVSGRTDERAAIDLTGVEGSQAESLHLPLPECSDAATLHNSGSYRMDLAPETTQPCTASAETDVRTGGTSASPGSADSVGHTGGNSTGLGGSDDRPLAQTAPRIAGMSSCTCSYYREVADRISHFATFPTEIPRRCILAGSRPGDMILDPFAGSGTTLMVADRLGRDAVGIELNPDYAEMARRRIADDAGPMFEDVAVEQPAQVAMFEDEM